jgi:hypothetical protein
MLIVVAVVAIGCSIESSPPVEDAPTAAGKALLQSINDGLRKRIPTYGEADRVWAMRIIDRVIIQEAVQTSPDTVFVRIQVPQDRNRQLVRDAFPSFSEYSMSSNDHLKSFFWIMVNDDGWKIACAQRECSQCDGDGVYRFLDETIEVPKDLKDEYAREKDSLGFSLISSDDPRWQDRECPACVAGYRTKTLKELLD